MPVYYLNAEQKIPQSLDTVWEFIANPKNLKLIAPPYIGFDITTQNLPDKMYAGMIIGYIVKPLFKIKMRWLTEITHLREKEYFVDEQRAGPYAMWHHQHKLSDLGDHVLMADIVTYKPPLGMLGSIANTILIRRQLNNIFDYRREAIEKKFGKIE